MCVSAYTCPNVYLLICGTTFRSQSLLSSMWVLGIELRWVSLEASPQTQEAISPAQKVLAVDLLKKVPIEVFLISIKFKYYVPINFQWYYSCLLVCMWVGMYACEEKHLYVCACVSGSQRSTVSYTKSLYLIFYDRVPQ